MVNIAALLFRMKVSNDKSQFVTIPKILKELVPADQLKAMSENEWKKVRGPFKDVLKDKGYDWSLSIVFFLSTNLMKTPKQVKRQSVCPNVYSALC